MFPLSSDILMLSDEAAVLAEKGILLFANASAKEILGADCVGKSVAALLGPEIAEVQAPSFVADIPLSGERRTVRVSRAEGVQLIFLSRPDTSPALLSSAYLCSMRNSLSNLGLSLEQLRSRLDDVQDEKLTKSLAALTKSYYTAARLLSNASNAYALFHGGLATKRSAVDLVSLCEELTGTLRMLLPEISFRLRTDARPILWADPVLLHSLLLNLISNCIHHAKGLTSVSLGVLCTNEHVILSVSDDGCGVRPEQMHSIFSRYRYEFSMNDLVSGAGLGLTVARGIAEAHGGILLLESREGKGTTVRASLTRSSVPTGMRSEETAYQTGIRELLIGLADALPADCFRAQFLD